LAFVIGVDGFDISWVDAQAASETAIAAFRISFFISISSFYVRMFPETYFAQTCVHSSALLHRADREAGDEPIDPFQSLIAYDV
jgi:hypothetical protein